MTIGKHTYARKCGRPRGLHLRAPLMRLVRAYSTERLEAACRQALVIGTVSYRSVKSIFATGRGQTAAAAQHTLSLPAQHAHIRGPEYYSNSQNGGEA